VRECLRWLLLYRGFHRFIPTLLKMSAIACRLPVLHRPRRFGTVQLRRAEPRFIATAPYLLVVR